MKGFKLEQEILDNGTYRLLEDIVYTSPRYGKTITVPYGRISDGATGAMDITSRGWWIHDELCLTGHWDDGTRLTNWECSQVLQDVLAEEGRYWQSKRWFWATWLFGGGRARKNGLLMLTFLLLTGCAYNSQTITNSGAGSVTCTGSVDKPVDVGTTLQGNVPLNGGTVSNPAQSVATKGGRQ